MAAGTLAAPGTEYGPCAEPCEHRDCAESRWVAGSQCPWCGESIGYGTRFYRVGDGDSGEQSYAHALCEERRIEEGR